MIPTHSIPHSAALPSQLPAPETLQRQYGRICVIGLGYVGLPTALLFAQHGFAVQGVDVNPTLVEQLNTPEGPTHNPELVDWWQGVQAMALSQKSSEGPTPFYASTQPAPADVFLIAVPTPVHPDTHTCDLSAVLAATKAIAPVLQPGNVVILESTVPPGTTRHHVQPILEQHTGLKAGKDFHLCFSPERILPGNTCHELVHNHRVLGSQTPESALLAQAIFAQVIEGQIFVTDDLTAEFCKLAENTYRDVNIALANELSIIADELGIDIHQAIPLINQHPRVNLLRPGIGVGGHCIAVDPWFFVELSPSSTELIATSRRINDRMPHVTVQKILADLVGIFEPVICVAGLTYKPDVADTRESPALKVVELLRAKGLTVRTYDPVLEPLNCSSEAFEAQLTGADYLAVLVPHTPIRQFLADKADRYQARMRTPRIRVF